MTRRELEGLVQIFLDEKSFEGCGGLKITDEIRITIAAYACILLLGFRVVTFDASLYMIAVGFLILQIATSSRTLAILAL